LKRKAVSEIDGASASDAGLRLTEKPSSSTQSQERRVVSFRAFDGSGMTLYSGYFRKRRFELNVGAIIGSHRERVNFCSRAA
jgi:hypothetical protein